MPVWFFKYVLPSVLVGLLVWAAVEWRKSDIEHWKQAGRTELQNEIAVATAKAEEETRAKQAAIRKQSNEVKYEIRKNLDGDRPVSPVLARQLDRMRERARARSK